MRNFGWKRVWYFFLPISKPGQKCIYDTLKKAGLWPQKVKLVNSKSEDGDLNDVKVATSIMWQEIERNAFFATLTCKSPAVTQLSSENQTLSECSFPWTVFPWVDHKLKMSLSLPPFPPSAALDVDSCSCVWFLLKMSCCFNFFLRDRVKYLVCPHLLNFQNSKISCSRFFRLHNVCS